MLVLILLYCIWTGGGVRWKLCTLFLGHIEVIRDKSVDQCSSGSIPTALAALCQ